MPQSKIIHYGPWQIPVKATGVICPDGIRRTCKVRAADTFFTMPASVIVRGKNVSGYIDTIPSYGDDPNAGELAFHPSQSGKNNWVFWRNAQEARDYIESKIATNSYFTEFAITAPNWTVTLKREYRHGPYTIEVQEA